MRLRFLRAPSSAPAWGGYGFRDFDAVPRFTPSPGLGQPVALPRHAWLLAAWAACFVALVLFALRRERRHQRA